MAKKEKIVKEKKPRKVKCEVSIKILGKTYEAKGDTLAEALLSITPQSTKGRGILTVKKGDYVKERVLPPFAVSRLFSLSPLTQEIAIKNTSLLFDL